MKQNSCGMNECLINHPIENPECLMDIYSVHINTKFIQISTFLVYHQHVITSSATYTKWCKSIVHPSLITNNTLQIAIPSHPNSTPHQIHTHLFPKSNSSTATISHILCPFHLHSLVFLEPQPRPIRALNIPLGTIFKTFCFVFVQVFGTEVVDACTEASFDEIHVHTVGVGSGGILLVS